MPSSLILRQVKGSELTFSELDGNLLSLKNHALPVISLNDWNVNHLDAATPTLDVSAAIQAAIDAANAEAVTGKVWTGLAGYGAIVHIPAARWQIAAQLINKAGVLLWVDGVIVNNIADSYTPGIVFNSKSHCMRLLYDAKNKNGVVFGEAGVTNGMTVGDVRLWNVGKSSSGGTDQVGALFQGREFEINRLRVSGGKIGCDFNAALDLRMESYRSTNADTGFNIRENSEGVSVDRIVVDSPTFVGGRIDKSRMVDLSNVKILNYDTSQANPCTSGYAMIVGDLSSGNIVSGLSMSLHADNTDGIALKVANIDESSIDLSVSKIALSTGAGHPIQTAIEYGSGVLDVSIKGNVNPSIAEYVGQKAGVLDLGAGLDGWENASNGVSLPVSSLTKTPSYNTNGTIKWLEVVYRSNTYRQTWTYAVDTGALTTSVWTLQ